MSERIEIKDDGYSIVIKPKGKGQARLFVNDTDSITQRTIAAIRQQQADIAGLRAERDRLALLQEEAIANELDANEELSELRAELAAIKAAQLDMVTRKEMESHGISEYDRGYRDGYG